MMCIDFAVSKDCINNHSYGVICVRCGCCSRNSDYRDRLRCCIRYYKECLKEEYSFSCWSNDEYWRKVQEKNIQENILYFKRKIRRYKKLLRAAGRSRYAERF